MKYSCILLIIEVDLEYKKERFSLENVSAHL